jgi:putative mRNA 3-end processing factor
MPEPLLRFTDSGIYSPAGQFYIDPWRPVDRAIITHAHSDHARFGSKYYLAHKNSVPLLKLRLGSDINVQGLEYLENLDINGINISLHPAGHIIGSAQIRVEYQGEVWVVSGDYKTENDGISVAFEPVKCHKFTSESTFGLPVYRWKPQAEIFENIHEWWRKNRENDKTSILFAYSLGKAQRLIHHLDASIGPMYGHKAICNVQNALADFGLPVKRLESYLNFKKNTGALIISTPSSLGSPWLNRFDPYVTGVCSGWMQVRGQQRRRNADAGFALSDHADWPGLLSAIRATEAEKVYITHGYQAIFSRYLNEIGIASQEVLTSYGDETNEDVPES